MAQACNPSSQLKSWLPSTTETLTNTLSAMTIMKKIFTEILAQYFYKGNSG